MCQGIKVIFDFVHIKLKSILCKIFEAPPWTKSDIESKFIYMRGSGSFSPQAKATLRNSQVNADFYTLRYCLFYPKPIIQNYQRF